LQKLGQLPDTELGVFKYKRYGTRSVKLEVWESGIIKSLLGMAVYKKSRQNKVVF
jgi:hypothetical protein